MFEHVIHGPGDLVGRGHQGLGRATPPFEAPVERAKGAVGARNRLGRHAEGLRRTITIFQGAAFQHLPAGDIIFRGEPQPGAKMFGVGPFAHIGPNLGHNRLGNRIAHPVHRHEINAR